MSSLSHSELTTMFLSLALLLALARVLGEISQRIGQPSVLGEILAGVLLGPTVLGTLSPEAFHFLFPRAGNAPLVLDGLTNLAITLFLLVAGLEVDLSTVWKQGRTALIVGITGVVLPFAVGFGVGYAAPELMGFEPGADRIIFALFIATALSISALPIIAKTLMDLNLYRSDFGMLVVAAAVLNDIVGWLVFAVILSMLAEGQKALSPSAAIALTLGFTAFMLTIVRWGIHRVLPWLQARSSWPGGVLGFALSITLFAAAFTEWIGVHAIFGAFLAGVAIGDSRHLRARTRLIIERFVSFIFAPLFFASIGLKVNFFAAFDPVLVLVVFVIATIGKIGGCLLGGRLSGMPTRQAWATGFAMNARGAMEIILGLLALQYGLISDQLFVALVIMALGTAVISGPLLHRILQLQEVRHFSDYLHPEAFRPLLKTHTAEAAIKELAAVAAEVATLDVPHVTEIVARRENLRPTGLAGGLAIPNALIEGLQRPVIALGLSREGIDFDAPDGAPSQVIALTLIPSQQPDLQLDLLADLGHTFRDKTLLARVVGTRNFTELLALLRLHGSERDEHEGDDIQVARREGVLIVGARPLGRAIASRLRSAGWKVRLVDSSKLNCDAAVHEGFEAVTGSALEETTLFQAQAFNAQALLALTPNFGINLRAARFAHHEFDIPDCFALAPRELRVPSGELEDLRIITMPPGGPSIEEWDIALTRGEVEWKLIPEEPDRPDAEASESAGKPAETDGEASPSVGTELPEGIWDGEPVLAAIAESAGGKLYPVGVPHDPVPGERYWALHLRSTRTAPRSRVDQVLETCPILDLPAATNLATFARRVSEILADRTRHSASELQEKLHSREQLSTTILESGLAVPHVLVEGNNLFELIAVRCREGIDFGQGAAPVHTAFVSVASADQRNLHLRMLSAIVQIVRSPLFESAWLSSDDPKRLREVLVFAERKRDVPETL